MIWKFSLLVIRLVHATESFGVGLLSQERSLKTCLTTINDLRNALYLWRSSQSQAENNFGKIENWCITGLTTLEDFLLKNTAEFKTFNENISGWDTSQVTDLLYSFHGQQKFNGAIGFWDVSQATDLEECFFDAKAFNSDLSGWDTSRVTKFRKVFENASEFNGDISTWNVSKSQDFWGMFTHTEKFNSNISNWNLSGGLISLMFWDAEVFNCDINSWDISNIDNIFALFSETNEFNSDLSEWDTGKVTAMNNCFAAAKGFNGSLSGWDTSKVTRFLYCFSEAYVFNSDISSWDISNMHTEDMYFLFSQTNEFNSDLSDWDTGKISWMMYLFYEAKGFNGSLFGWDTSKVGWLTYSFFKAISFNRDISQWDTSSLIDMEGSFEGATVFNQSLSKWDISNVRVDGGFHRTFFDASALNQCFQWGDLSAHNHYIGGGVSTLLDRTGGSYFSENCPTPTQIISSAPTSKPTSSPTSKPTSSPTSKPTSSPASKPTSSPTSKPTSSPPSTVAPTTEAQVFLAKNFTIGSPQVTYMDVNGEPQFHFLYKVGASVASLRFSLFREGCTSTKNVTDILTLRNESDGNGTYSKLISVDPTEIQGSPLVIPELGLKGFSAGIINFCVKAEVLMGQFSVEFLKSEVSLAYDLSNNTFAIDIVTEAKEVEKFNRTSDFGYGVDVCQCLVTGYDCSTAAFNIKQGELVAICLSPNNKSKNVTQISKFSMDFNQNKILQYTAATIGASGTEPGALSLLQSSGHTQKVLSRMVTELYDGGATFNVTGVAYLRFKNKRLLAAVKTQNIRRIQAPEVSDEDAPFRLSIGIEKTKVVDNKATMDPLTILIVTSVTIALTLVFCVYKKFA